MILIFVTGPFKELLERDGFIPIHNRNLQILKTDMLKVYSDIAPPIFTEIFSKLNLNCELRHTLHFSVPHVKSVYSGTESISFLCPKNWDIMPTRLEKTPFSVFK